jgi:hypothetical protein
MLPVFPVPHPGEVFYSVIARAYELFDPGSRSNFDEMLFGSRFGTRHVGLPTGLERFEEALPPGYPFDAAYLIQNHSLFPIISGFFDQDDRVRLAKAMMGTDVRKSIHAVGGARSLLAEPLRLCPNCFEAQVATEGEPYWATIHQIPGARICLIHGTELEASTLQVHSGRVDFRRTTFVSAAKAAKIRSSAPPLTESDLRGQAKYLKGCLDLQGCPVLHRHQLSAAYGQILEKRGLAQRMSSGAYRVRLKPLLEVVQAEHAANLGVPFPFRRQHADRDVANTATLRDCTFTKHLLLLSALGISVKKFLETAEEMPMVRKVTRTRHTTSPETTSRHRMTFDQFLKEHPHATRSQVGSGINTAYNHLLIHDREWILKRLAKRPRVHQGKRPSEEKDEKARSLINKAIAFLRNAEDYGRPVRPSTLIGFLSRSEGAYVRRHSDLPRTKVAIMSVVEDEEAFIRRRLRKVARMAPEGRPRNVSGILRLCGLSGHYYISADSKSLIMNVLREMNLVL